MIPAIVRLLLMILADAYYDEIRGLVDGGSDVLLIETIFDTLNAKAALFAADKYAQESGKRLPIMISGTITDASGRTLSGQTVEAFWNSVRHANLLSVGLNCALGASRDAPAFEELSEKAGCIYIGLSKRRLAKRVWSVRRNR